MSLIKYDIYYNLNNKNNTEKLSIMQFINS